MSRLIGNEQHMTTLREKPAIFILGSERSGTNLLRSILSSHSKISSPPPSGMVVGLHPVFEAFKSAGVPLPLDKIISYASELTQTHLNKWVHCPAPDDVLEVLPTSPNFWDLFAVYNSYFTEQSGGDIWLSKEPGLIGHAVEIAANFPNSHIVHLVRDGRDVAASMVRKRHYANTMRQGIVRWTQEQEKMLSALNDGRVTEITHMIRYEDLITSPEEVLRPLMKCVGLEFEASQLEYYSTSDTITHAQSSIFWRELAQPIKADNSKKYLKEMGARELEYVEAEASAILEKFGYELHNSNPRPIRLHEKLGEKLRDKADRRPHDAMSPEEIEQRKRLGELLGELNSLMKSAKGG